MKKYSQKEFGLFALLITMAVVSVVVWLVVRDSNQTLDTTTDISNWKTYRNEKYGYEIMLPKDWQVVENPEKYYVAFGKNITEASDAPIPLSIRSLSKNDFEQQIKNLQANPNSVVENVRMLGHTTLKIFYPADSSEDIFGPAENYFMFKLKDGSGLSIKVPKLFYTQIPNLMLNTFKFIN